MYSSITINGSNIGRVISNNQVIWSKSKANPINRFMLPDGQYAIDNLSQDISLTTNTIIPQHGEITQIEYDGKVINATLDLVSRYENEVTYNIQTAYSDKNDFLNNFLKLDQNYWWISKPNPRPVYAII